MPASTVPLLPRTLAPPLLLLILLLLLSIQAFTSPPPTTNRLLLKRDAIKQQLRALASNAQRLAALDGAYEGAYNTNNKPQAPNIFTQTQAAFASAVLLHPPPRRILLRRRLRPLPLQRLLLQPARSRRWRRRVRSQTGEHPFHLKKQHSKALLSRRRRCWATLPIFIW